MRESRMTLSADWLLAGALSRRKAKMGNQERRMLMPSDDRLHGASILSARFLFINYGVKEGDTSNLGFHALMRQTFPKSV